MAGISNSDQYNFEQVDICNHAETDCVLARHQTDAIMHLAAENHVDRSIDGPAEFIETKIVGSYALLDAIRQYWQAMDAERKVRFRFHHINTDEVYGDLPHQVESENAEDHLFLETTPFCPKQPIFSQ